MSAEAMVSSAPAPAEHGAETSLLKGVRFRLRPALRRIARPEWLAGGTRCRFRPRCQQFLADSDLRRRIGRMSQLLTPLK